MEEMNRYENFKIRTFERIRRLINGGEIFTYKGLVSRTLMHPYQVQAVLEYMENSGLIMIINKRKNNIDFVWKGTFK